MFKQSIYFNAMWLLILGLAFLCYSSSSPAQSSSSGNSPVLFTFGNEKVSVDEFKYVYEKNNMGDDSLYTLPSLKEYLDLYINFRLKVREAERMGIDTQQSIQKELATYRKQLSESYLTDKKVTKKLLKEAYRRMKEARKVSHILIKVEDNAPPGDTMKAYQKAKKLRQRIQNGADFNKVARQESEDRYAEKNGGRIGYVTAFQTVYPFENAAYRTEVGAISDPVRTQYGYHLIKVEDKKSAGQSVKVAHILKKVPKDASAKQNQSAKKKIHQLYDKINDGADFRALARKHSDDRRSSRKGGKLPEFGVGKMDPKFEEASFDLKEGQVSEPFRTQYGWHIVKLFKKEKLPSFEEMKPKLKKKVKKSKRSNIAKEKLIEKMKDDYNYKEHKKATEELKNRLKNLFANNKFTTSAVEDMTDPIFELEDTVVQQKDFAHYMNKHTRNVAGRQFNQRFKRMFETYGEKTLMQYERDRLAQKYTEFKSLMREYRDGILLFELTDRQVWSKAIEDTMGLKKYYQKNKENYMWNERAEATIYTLKDPRYAMKARKMAKRFLVGDKKIKKKLNNKENHKVITIEQGTYEQGQNEYLKQLKWKKGLSDTIHTNNKNVVFAKIDRFISPETKTLEEAKGYIVSDYQEHLEQRWIDNLRQKYPVDINKDVLRSLAKDQ